MKRWGWGFSMFSGSFGVVARFCGISTSALLVFKVHFKKIGIMRFLFYFSVIFFRKECIILNSQIRLMLWIKIDSIQQVILLGNRHIALPWLNLEYFFFDDIVHKLYYWARLEEIHGLLGEGKYNRLDVKVPPVNGLVHVLIGSNVSHIGELVEIDKCWC